MQHENSRCAEASEEPAAASVKRRYDVDWLRTLAMGLLIVYHIVLSFQPWGASINFPQNEELLEEIWPFMALINIWRIPLLFLISGMGVRFAMERRDWKQMLKDRTLRILVPYVFGIVVLSPILAYSLPRLGWDADYTPGFGHLWFLLNIFFYFTWLFGIVMWFKDSPNSGFLRMISNLLRRPLGLYVLAIPIVLEAWLVDPVYFSLYADTIHGWLIGLVCFSIGIVAVSLQGAFWPAVSRHRWISLVLAVALYLVRLLIFKLEYPPNPLTALESMSWMLAILGFGSVLLNRPSRGLGYFSRAVYPVYIVHMPVQFVVSYYLLPLSLPAFLKLILLTAGTFGVSLLLYEFFLRRLRWIRPLFGMKLNQA